MIELEGHASNPLFLALGEYLSIQFAMRLMAWVALLSLLYLPLAAQEATPPSASDSRAQDPAATQQLPASDKDKNSDKDKDKKKDAQDATGQGKVAGTSNDRLLFALPNFLTLQNGGHVPPLTTKQKFAVVARGTFDYVQYPWWAFLSAINQADDSEPGFGQGWESYGKRYGTTAADSTIENFMTGAIFPSILRQDPRFFQSGEGGFIRRTWYAATRIVVTRSDAGHPQFNYSEVLGSALSAAIANYSYHPKSTYISTPTNPHLFVPSDRTLKNTAKVWGTQVSYDTMTIVIKEFWPDIHRKLSHKQAAPSQ